MDWSSCIICGGRKGEPLKCPVDSPHEDCEQVYKVFLQNVEQFKEFDALPVNLKIGPEVIFELLVKCRASWHKSCHLKFSNSKLEREKNKRKSDDYQDETLTTFDSYVENVFIPFQSSKRVDIVWDTYKASSVKDSTREKRGSDQRRK